MVAMAGPSSGVPETGFVFVESATLDIVFEVLLVLQDMERNKIAMPEIKQVTFETIVIHEFFPNIELIYDF